MIPMDDPRHPRFERLERERLQALGLYRPPRDSRPTQYEDQYGSLRWSDDNSRVERGVHGGR